MKDGEQDGQMTNEPDSSLLFCSEEQSSRLSLCNYHHHIVHARFPLTRGGDHKSLSFPFNTYVSPSSYHLPINYN
jgi:hypothetical protein